eukprot:gene14544-22254_t
MSHSSKEKPWRHTQAVERGLVPTEVPRTSVEYRIFTTEGPREIPKAPKGTDALSGPTDAASIMKHVLACNDKQASTGLGRIVLSTPSLDSVRDCYWWAYLRYFCHAAGFERLEESEKRSKQRKKAGGAEPSELAVLPLHMYSFKAAPTKRTLQHLARVSAPGSSQHGLTVDELSSTRSPRHADAPPSPANSNNNNASRPDSLAASPVHANHRHHGSQGLDASLRGKSSSRGLAPGDIDALLSRGDSASARPATRETALNASFAHLSLTARDHISGPPVLGLKAGRPAGDKADHSSASLRSQAGAQSDSGSPPGQQLSMAEREELVEAEEKELYSRIARNYVVIVRRISQHRSQALQDMYHTNYSDLVAQAVVVALAATANEPLRDVVKKEVLGFVTYWMSGVQRTSVDHWNVPRLLGRIDADAGTESGMVSIGGASGNDTPARRTSGAVPPGDSALPPPRARDASPAPPPFGPSGSPASRSFYRRSNQPGAASSPEAGSQRPARPANASKRVHLHHPQPAAEKAAEPAGIDDLKAALLSVTDPADGGRKQQKQAAAGRSAQYPLASPDQRGPGRAHLAAPPPKKPQMRGVVHLLGNHKAGGGPVPPWHELGRVALRKPVTKVTVGNFCTTDHSPLMST